MAKALLVVRNLPITVDGGAIITATTVNLMCDGKQHEAFVLEDAGIDAIRVETEAYVQRWAPGAAVDWADAACFEHGEDGEVRPTENLFASAHDRSA